jgi:hypothetical protein
MIFDQGGLLTPVTAAQGHNAPEHEAARCSRGAGFTAERQDKTAGRLDRLSDRRLTAAGLTLRDVALIRDRFATGPRP